MGDAPLLAHRLHEQHDDVPTLRLDRIALVEANRIGPADLVDVVHHHAALGAGRCQRLEEAARGDQDLVLLRDVHLVGLDLRLRLDAQVAGVDEGEMPHVEEVLDRPQARDGDPEGAARDADAVLLVAFGEMHDVPGRLAERREDVAVLDTGGERRAGVAAQDPEILRSAARDFERDVEELRPEGAARAQELELGDGVPIVHQDGVNPVHVPLLPAVSISISRKHRTVQATQAVGATENSCYHDGMGGHILSILHVSPRFRQRPPAGLDPYHK